MSFVDDSMNQEFARRQLPPVSRDDGAQAPVGDIQAQNSPQEPLWSAGGLIAAEFRQNNTLGSLTYLPGNRTEVPGYSYWDDIKNDPKWEPHYSTFSWYAPRSPGATEAIKRSIVQQEEDRKEIAAAPAIASIPMGLVAGLVDPTLLIPAGGAIRGVKGGYSIAKSALNTAIAGGVAASVMEGVFQGTQTERPLSESAVNIGGGILLGGLLGAGSAALFNGLGARAGRKLANRMLDGYDGIAENPPSVTTASEVLAGHAPPEWRPGMKEKFERYETARAEYTQLARDMPEGASFETHPHVGEAQLRMQEARQELNDVPFMEGVGKADFAERAAARLPEADARELKETLGEVEKLTREHAAEVRKLPPDAEKGDFPHVDELEARIADLHDRVGYLAQKAEAFAPVESTHVAAISSGGAKPAGAEAAHAATLADLSISGRIAAILGKWTSFMNPAMRATQRMIAPARQVMLDLQGGTVYHAMNDAFQAATPGGAVMNRATSKMLGRLAAAQDDHLKIFAEMNKTGTKMDRGEFDRKVGLVMSQDDKSDNPWIQKSAEAWRKKVFDPFYKEAVAGGLTPADLDVKGALSYFSRVYDRNLIIAFEGEFKTRLMPVMEQRLKSAFDAQTEKLEYKKSIAQWELDMLHASDEDRAAMLAENDAILEKLGMRGSAETQRQIVEMNRAALALEKAGDTAGGQALREEVKQLKTSAGRDYKNYREAKSMVAKQNRLLRLSASGQEAERNRVLDDLVKVEDAQRAALENYAARIGVNRRRFSKVKPEEEQAFIEENMEVLRKATGGAWENLLKLQGQRDKIEEKIAKANEVIAKKTQTAASGPGGSNLEALYVQQQEAQKLVDSLKPAKARIEGMMNKQQQIHERLNAIEEKLDNAADDFDEARTAIDEAYTMLTDTAADKALMKGERTQRLKEKLKELGPENTKREIAKREKFIRDMETKHEVKWGTDVEAKPDFSRMSKEIVDDFTNKVTGRNVGERESDLAEYATPVTKGPLKGRTSYFTDDLLNQPIAGKDTGFLDTDVVRVAHRYARIMSAEIELTRQFGRADMRDQLAGLDKAYAEAADKVAQAPDVKTAWESLGIPGKAPKTKEEIAIQLDRDHKGATDDIKAVRDLIRGTYKVAENQGNFGRLSRALTSFNYIRSMGGVVISNLTELYRPAMVHGLAPYMGLGVKALTGQLEGIKLSVREAKLAGLVAERVLHHRLASQWGEIADPLAHGTVAERMMENAARVANKWSGLSLFTDFEEGIAATMTQDRLINGLMKGVDSKGNELTKAEDLRWMAMLNLDKGMRRSIADQIAKHGEKVDGVWVANTERWTARLEEELSTLDSDSIAYRGKADELKGAEAAVDAYRQAVLKDVNSVIVQRRAGDVPLFMSTPLGRILLQFRAYNLAAHQKVMLRGFQEGPGAFASGLVAMTSAGMLVSYLQAVRGGQERLDKWKTSAMNPGFLIGEGLDKSGLFPALFDVNNTADAAFRASGFNFNPLKTPMISAFPQQAQSGDSSRWNPNNNMLGNLLGPSAGLIQDLPMAFGAVAAKARGMDVGSQGQGAVNRVTPFGSYLGMKEFIQLLQGNSPYMRK